MQERVIPLRRLESHRVNRLHNRPLPALCQHFGPMDRGTPMGYVSARAHGNDA